MAQFIDPAPSHLQLRLPWGGLQVVTSNDNYELHFDWAKSELKGLEAKKQETIRELARRLEHDGMPSELISSEIAKQLDGYASARYIRQCLNDRYKQKGKARDTQISVCGGSSANLRSLTELETGNSVSNDNHSTREEEVFKNDAEAGIPEIAEDKRSSNHVVCPDCKKNETTIVRLQLELAKPFEAELSKEEHDEVLNHMQRARTTCYLKFDRKGRLLDIESDRERMSRN
jgi:hypothetical protein